MSSQSSHDTMVEQFAIGIDIGTSTVKGAVVSSHGGSFAYTSLPYPTSVLSPGFAEQDADHWWSAIGEVLDQIVIAHPSMSAANTIIGLTGQMHTTVIRDRTGELLRPAILWSDTRAEASASRLAKSVERWADICGYSPIPAFTSAHLAWLKDHEPDVFAKISTIAVPKDDIRARLGAGWATEPSDASAMNLMDTRADQWSAELLEIVGIGKELLPPIVPSKTITGRVRSLPPTSSAADHLVGTPVIAGAGDQAAQALALGVTGDGDIGISVGTSGAVFQSIRAPRAGAFRHALPDAWLALDSTHAAGLALAWWSSISGVPFAQVAEAVGKSAEPPTFLPYLQGARDGRGAPGTLTDLRATHGVEDISRAVLEGVAIELVRLTRLVANGSVPESPVAIGGRAAQIGALRELLSAGLQRTVTHSARGPAYGIAALAADTNGWLAQHQALNVDREDTVDPDPETVKLFTARFARYVQLTEQLS